MIGLTERVTASYEARIGTRSSDEVEELMAINRRYEERMAKDGMHVRRCGTSSLSGTPQALIASAATKAADMAARPRTGSTRW